MVINSILEVVGNTPLLKLNKIIKRYDLKANLYAKLEYLKNKDVTVNVVSKSGTTVEILATLNIVERFMKNKYKNDYKN